MNKEAITAQEQLCAELKAAHLSYGRSGVACQIIMITGFAIMLTVPAHASEMLFRVIVAASLVSAVGAAIFNHLRSTVALRLWDELHKLSKMWDEHEAALHEEQAP